jgi:hypothetical protein
MGARLVGGQAQPVGNRRMIYTATDANGGACGDWASVGGVTMMTVRLGQWHCPFAVVRAREVGFVQWRPTEGCGGGNDRWAQCRRGRPSTKRCAQTGGVRPANGDAQQRLSGRNVAWESCGE